MNDLLGIMIGFVITFSGLLYYTYDNLEYKGYPRISSCTGECYEEYVRKHGTAVEQLVAKQEAASLDEYSSIRGLWAGCAACHGNEGQGIGAFPKLAGSSASYISEALYQYQRKETRGAMSATMWAQAGMLSDTDIETLSKYIENELE